MSEDAVLGDGTNEEVAAGGLGAYTRSTSDDDEEEIEEDLAVRGEDDDDNVEDDSDEPRAPKDYCPPRLLVIMTIGVLSTDTEAVLGYVDDDPDGEGTALVPIRISVRNDAVIEAAAGVLVSTSAIKYTDTYKGGSNGAASRAWHERVGIEGEGVFVARARSIGERARCVGERARSVGERKRGLSAKLQKILSGQSTMTCGGI
jgi:hypothetical protein